MAAQKTDVLLVTCAQFPTLTEDDRILEKALTKIGLSVQAAVWDSKEIDWSTARLAVVRSVMFFLLLM